MVLEIEQYRFGSITVGGRTYHKDLIVFSDQVFPNWRRETGHSLSLADLQQVLENPPHTLVVGQGTHRRMQVPENTRRALEALGIRLIAKPTQEACVIYNRLCEEESIAAALHLTC